MPEGTDMKYVALQPNGPPIALHRPITAAGNSRVTYRFIFVNVRRLESSMLICGRLSRHSAAPFAKSV
jgi:hypothetical protein